MKRLLMILPALLVLMMAACIEDSVSTSPNDQPQFSCDTLSLGPCFTGQPTATRSFMVYNPHSKVMSINTVALTDDTDGAFRINVDGQAGTTFSNVEIRPNDSIFVMVEATVPTPPSGQITRTSEAIVQFVTNGVTRQVVLTATASSVEVVRALIVERDTILSSPVPYQVYDSLVVRPGATLTLAAGTELLFHSGASLEVRGTLLSLGTADQPVTMNGDRLDNVVGEIPFDVMSSQWQGVTFHPTSTDNHLSHTVIKNTIDGVMADSVKGSPGILFDRCRLRNAASTSFFSWFSNVEAVGTEFSDASMTPLLLCGGTFNASHITVANYYLFAAISEPLLAIYHYDESSKQVDGEPWLQADIRNSIFYGLGTDMTVGDLDGTDIYLRRCAMKSSGVDDEHFINMLWAIDPLYFTVRDEYYFDYRLQEDSECLGAADRSMQGSFTIDMNGQPYSATVGAFQ